MQNCVILAGGKSSRMQRDKTLLPFSDEPSLTHFQVKRLSKIFKNVLVSSKGQKFDPPLDLITDSSNNFSPMFALFDILNHFKSGHVFIIPADMPFFSETSIKILSNFCNNFDIIVPQDSKHTHSLCGFFDAKIINTIKTLCDNNEHKIGLLFELCKSKKVKFDDSDEFINLNYPYEYDNAVKMRKK